MGSLKVGSKFIHDHVDYEVITRFENYIMVKAWVTHGPRFWTCGPVLERDGHEFARLNVTNFDRDSACFDEQRMKAIFDTEVAKLKNAQRAEKERIQAKRLSDEKIAAWNKLRAEMEERKGVLIVELQGFVADLKNIERLASTKEVIKISNELDLISNILKYNKL